MKGTIKAPDRIDLGFTSMLVAVAGLTVMDAAAKWLCAGYPVAEVVFFVNLFALGAASRSNDPPKAGQVV